MCTETETDTEGVATSGVSRHDDAEPRTDRLLRRRAGLVERRNVIVLGKARDDYNRMIAEIDRRLEFLRKRSVASVAGDVRGQEASKDTSGTTGCPDADGPSVTPDDPITNAGDDDERG